MTNPEALPIQVPSIEWASMIEPRPEWQIEECKLALTKTQKTAIRERDDNRCQFPDHLNGHKHECGGNLNVHHILPQGYCNELNINPDFPENCLTLCENSHKLIHPDMEYARKHWVPKGDSYLKVQEKRKDSLEHKEVYWVTTWDRAMSATAVRRTQQKEKEGWRFPKLKREFFDEDTGEIYKYQDKLQ